MNIELVTKQDLIDFKNEILSQIVESQAKYTPNKYYKSREMMELLNCSENQLRSLRIKGEIKAAKIGGDWYYDYQSIENKFKE